MDEHQARNWLSEPRYERFLETARGSREQAVVLYEWHVELTVASFGLIHRFEVLLRNAIDGALGAGQPQMPIKDTWLLDFEILQPDGIKQVITAIERLEKGKLVTRGRVVAGLRGLAYRPAGLIRSVSGCGPSPPSSGARATCGPSPSAQSPGAPLQGVAR